MIKKLAGKSVTKIKIRLEETFKRPSSLILSKSYQREISKRQLYFFLLKNKTKTYAEVVLISCLSKLHPKSTSKQREVSVH